jgi:hypothetical protein
MIEREILFRVLSGPQGGKLREIACADSRLSQVRPAIDWIRDNYAEPVRVEFLAAMTGTSVAAFYRHFKAVTSMAPIQYQKAAAAAAGAPHAAYSRPATQGRSPIWWATKARRNSVANMRACSACRPRAMRRSYRATARQQIRAMVCRRTRSARHNSQAAPGLSQSD